MLIGFGVFLPMYAAGGMAAGDVKLMAMAGAFLTPHDALWAAFFSLIAGGACGLLIVLVQGQALQTLGSPLIRAMGTLGGNLATASPAGDCLPPLLALEAELELLSPQGPRRLPLGTAPPSTFSNCRWASTRARPRPLRR